MVRVVLVHGIAQEQLAADVLEETWLPALAGGIRTAGFSRVADLLWRDRQGPDGIEARMAFYGHLFLRPDVQGEGPEELSQEEIELADKLALAWLEHSAQRTSRPSEKALAARELAFLEDRVGEELMGTRSAAREVMKSLARPRWFGVLGMGVAERLAWKAAAQVTRYFTNEGLHQRILEIVAGLIDDDTEVIIGHSLG